jgi:hypothetical protein
MTFNDTVSAIASARNTLGASEYLTSYSEQADCQDQAQRQEVCNSRAKCAVDHLEVIPIKPYETNTYHVDGEYRKYSERTPNEILRRPFALDELAS